MPLLTRATLTSTIQIFTHTRKTCVYDKRISHSCPRPPKLPFGDYTCCVCSKPCPSCSPSHLYACSPPVAAPAVNPRFASSKPFPTNRPPLMSKSTRPHHLRTSP